MVRCRPDLVTVLVAALVWFLTPPGAVAQDSAGPESLHWSVPPVLPPGALIAVVSGDPTGPGEFTLLVSMPNGYRIPPHSHPSYEHVEVKEGTLLVGTGDQLDPKMTQALAAGDSATAPAGCTISRSRREGPYCRRRSWARTRLPMCGLRTLRGHGLFRSVTESRSTIWRLGRQ